MKLMRKKRSSYRLTTDRGKASATAIRTTTGEATAVNIVVAIVVVIKAGMKGTAEAAACTDVAMVVAVAIKRAVE